MLQAQNRPLYPSFSLSYGLGFQLVIVKELERSDPGSSAWNTLGPFGNIHRYALPRLGALSQPHQHPPLAQHTCTQDLGFPLS